MSWGVGRNRLPALFPRSASPFPRSIDFPMPGKTHRWRSLRCEGGFELRRRFILQCRVGPEPVVEVVDELFQTDAQFIDVAVLVGKVFLALIVPLDLAQVQLVAQVGDEIRQMPFRQPLARTRRKKKILLRKIRTVHRRNISRLATSSPLFKLHSLGLRDHSDRLPVGRFRPSPKCAASV